MGSKHWKSITRTNIGGRCFNVSEISLYSSDPIIGLTGKWRIEGISGIGHLMYFEAKIEAFKWVVKDYFLFKREVYVPYTDTVWIDEDSFRVKSYVECNCNK